MKPALLLMTCLPLATLDATPPGWTWRQQDQQSLELRGSSGPVSRFLVDPAPRDPHFDVLSTADGRNLVWVGPPDHVWHYGHWFSWKLINGVNFWETDRATGASPGRTKVIDPRIETGDDSATIRYLREYRLPGKEAPVMNDRFEIVIRTPRGKFGPQVDWTITTTALEDVELGRTPPPDEPGGKVWGGYGGLSWRGAKEMKDVHFLDSEGREDMVGHRRHARWSNARGTLDDKPAGILLLDHPANPGHPTSWYLVQTPELPFWYLNPALVQPKPVKLAKGDSITCRYRVLPHDGTLVPDEIDAEARRFAGE